MTAQPDSRPATFKVAIIPVTPFQQNCSLIWDEASRAGAVVDPGGDLDDIRAAISQVGITIEKILLTHGHIDHAGGAEDLRNALGVKIEGPHRADKILLDNLEKQGAATISRRKTSHRIVGSTRATPSASADTFLKFCIAPAIRRARS